MQTKERQSATGVIEQLVDAPYRFRLPQMARLLVRWLGRHGMPPQQVWTQVLRFRNSQQLNFPASDIESLHMSGVTRWEHIPATLQAHGSVHIDIVPTMIGLLGNHGAMPLVYTERVAARRHNDKNPAARAFIDLLSHRMVALYCQSWDKYRLEHQVDVAGRDRQRELLLGLAGMPRHASPGSLVHPDAGALYAAMLRTRPVSASAMANIVSGYFRVPVTVQQFVGGWDDIPIAMRSTLGTANPALGYGAVLGTRMWRQDRRLRLVIGPLSPQDMSQFLPTGSGAKGLATLLTLFSPIGLIYELELLLDRACVRPLVLGQRKRLGWETFLLDPTNPAPAKKIGYRLHIG